MDRSSTITVVRVKRKPKQYRHYSQRTKPISFINSKGKVSASSRWNAKKSIDVNLLAVDVPKSISSLNQAPNQSEPKFRTTTDSSFFPLSHVNSKKISSSLTHFDSFRTKMHSNNSFASRIEPFSTSSTLYIIPRKSFFNDNEDKHRKQNQFNHHHRRRRRYLCGMNLSCCSPCCCLAISLCLGVLLIGLATLIGMLLIEKFSITTALTSTTSTATTTSTTLTTISTTTTPLTTTSTTTTTPTTTETTTSTITSAVTTTSTTASTAITTTTGSVSISSTRGNYYARDNIVISCSTPWTNVTIQITVPKTVGATFNGYSNSFAPGQINQSYIDNGSEIIYTWTIISGQTINCASGTYNVAAQYDLYGTAQPNNVNSYTIITTTSSGVTTVESGYF
ncbi:hypothetical protein I4U23_015448 [Adineta vaga]|nr:hypothetical protein I4U23_015448 [Adineta vaga]